MEKNYQHLIEENSNNAINLISEEKEDSIKLKEVKLNILYFFLVFRIRTKRNKN